jgi:ERCC4-type nuclease
MILDSREHGLKSIIPSATSSTLSVGDIWIGIDLEENKKGGLVIERKSVADLEASILDGRYREQRSRCMAFATEKGASLVYIIEGLLRGNRLATSALLKHITRLCIRYHIPVLRTGSLQETAELCVLLEDQWTNDKSVFEQPATLTYVETRGATRQANTDDPLVFATAVLASCRGVSSSIAQELLRAFGSLEGIFAATKEGLSAVKIGKQSFGKVKAERLHGLLHSVIANIPIPTNQQEPNSSGAVEQGPVVPLFE